MFLPAEAGRSGRSELGLPPGHGEMLRPKSGSKVASNYHSEQYASFARWSTAKIYLRLVVLGSG